MSAKLRVAWLVAGCAPGVRTIARSILFHCRTGLRDRTAGPFVECSSSVGGPKDVGIWAERLAHSKASVTKTFVIYIFSDFVVNAGGGQKWSRDKLLTDICRCLNPLAHVQTGKSQKKFPVKDRRFGAVASVLL